MLNDEKYYLQVEKELKDSIRDEALWSKSMILAKDDEAEAKVQYIKARVTKLQEVSAWKKVRPVLKLLRFLFIVAVIIGILDVVAGLLVGDL